MPMRNGYALINIHIYRILPSFMRGGKSKIGVMGCGVYDDASHSNGRTRSHASDAMAWPLLAFVFLLLI